MSTLGGPYETRNIRCLGVSDLGGWKTKVYEICQHKDIRAADGSQSPVITEAKEIVATMLEQPPHSPDRYGVGFLIVHRGKDRNWILMDWWYEREILKQILLSSPLDNPAQITVEHGNLLACTWELAVIAFERQAWVDTVLNNPNGPDLEGYCAKQLNAEL